jgi:hypothetical protein
LIEELRDRVRSLEVANLENRRIIAAFTQRIPELLSAETGAGPGVEADAPADARGQPRTASEGGEGGAPPGGTGAPAASERVPWWRMFGG